MELQVLAMVDSNLHWTAQLLLWRLKRNPLISLKWLWQFVEVLLEPFADTELPFFKIGRLLQIINWICLQHIRRSNGKASGWPGWAPSSVGVNSWRFVFDTLKDLPNTGLLSIFEDYCSWKQFLDCSLLFFEAITDRLWEGFEFINNWVDYRALFRGQPCFHFSKLMFHFSFSFNIC